MKTIKNHAGSLALASVALVGVLTACGGGGDDAGSLTEFNIQPATVTFTAPAGTATGVCTGGGSQDVFVYGGAAPYRVDNSLPDYVSINKAEVGSPGENFTLTVLGGCVTNGTIIVRDRLGRQQIFTVNNAPSAAASAASAP